jgi:aerobic carbon-monoxide dehydrogenase medium subunit
LATVKPQAFAYRRVSSIEEAVAVLAEEGDEAKLLAGGQSLAPMLNLRLANPAMLVDVGRIPLTAVEVMGDLVRVGAMVTHRMLEAHPTVAMELPLLRLAAGLIGHPAIRNRGTLGGSLAHADPAAELPVAALALGAKIVAQSARGIRTIPIEEFLDGPFMTALEADEMLTAVDFPRHGDCAVAFDEVAIRAGDFAVVAVATVFRRPTEGALTDVRVALGGVAGRAVRAREAEQRLEGHSPVAGRLREAGAAAASAITPGTDVHGSAAYRRGLVTALVGRAVSRAMDGALA